MIHTRVGERGPRSGADFRSSSGAGRVRKGSAIRSRPRLPANFEVLKKAVRKTAFHQPVIFRTRPSAGARRRGPLRSVSLERNPYSEACVVERSGSAAFQAVRVIDISAQNSKADDGKADRTGQQG